MLEMEDERLATSLRKRWFCTRQSNISCVFLELLWPLLYLGMCKARPEAVSQAKPSPNRPGQAGPCWRPLGGFGPACILEKPKPSRQAAAFQWENQLKNICKHQTLTKISDVKYTNMSTWHDRRQWILPTVLLSLFTWHPQASPCTTTNLLISVIVFFPLSPPATKVSPSPCT